MTKKDKSMCSGCYQDYYNQTGGIDGKGCWSFKTARVVNRTKVGTWQPPPYKWMPQETLNCHSPKGMHWIGKDDPRVIEDEQEASK